MKQILIILFTIFLVNLNSEASSNSRRLAKERREKVQKCVQIRDKITTPLSCASFSDVEVKEYFTESYKKEKYSYCNKMIKSHSSNDEINYHAKEAHSYDHCMQVYLSKNSTQTESIRLDVEKEMKFYNYLFLGIMLLTSLMLLSIIFSIWKSET